MWSYALGVCDEAGAGVVLGNGGVWWIGCGYVIYYICIYTCMHMGAVYNMYIYTYTHTHRCGAGEWGCMVNWVRTTVMTIGYRFKFLS